ncbi:uncharacterized protein [Penaeus vannamei]|uniref:uncharacterized protein isoform X2 n=1 Tax=Penaeus vannamei TaxID=6689 RepID=UPI00387F8DB8
MGKATWQLASAWVELAKALLVDRQPALLPCTLLPLFGLTSFEFNVLLKMASHSLLAALVWMAAVAVASGTPHFLEPSFVGHVSSATTAFTNASASRSQVQAKSEEHALEPAPGVADVSLWPGMEGNVVKRSAYSGYGCPPRETVTLTMFLTTTVEVFLERPTVISGPCHCEICSYSPSNNPCTCLRVSGCGVEIL